MDGLHKLKTPALYVSLFFQTSAIYLLFQATSLQSHSYLQEGLSRRALRDSQIPLENPNRPQQLQCSEGLALYQWGGVGCILLSMGSLSPFFMQRKKTRQDSERQPEMSRTEPDVSDPVMHGVYRNLKKGLEELESCLKSQPVSVNDSLLLRTVNENVRLMESRNRSTYECLLAGHDEIQKATTRLHRLMDQCRESANYSATNRVDWKKNKLVDVLSQMRQNLDSVVDLSKNINSIHGSTLRLLAESLQGESIFSEKIGRAQEHLERVQSGAHSGNKVHDGVISIIGESRDNITGASKFVSSMAQKWDGLVQMTEQIDEIAEKINAQSLAASMEMVRGQSGHGVTDLFPLGTELRGLAAKFHTYARHIKDAIYEVRDEINKTSQYLSQAGSKADHAFVSVNQCGEYYRNSVAAVKYSASELLLLQQEVGIHMKKLQETRTMGLGSADLMSNMDRYLQGHNNFSKKVMDETSQITVHSEKISTLLAKQYHELNHCQKILAQSAPLLSDSIRFSTETKQSISTLAACLDRIYAQGDEESLDSAPRGDDVLVTKIEDFKQLIASVKETMEPSTQSGVMKRSLAVQRSPATFRAMN